MNPYLSSLPPELLDEAAKHLDFAELTNFLSSSATIRQVLNTGPTVVKVGRLLLPFGVN